MTALLMGNHTIRTGRNRVEDVIPGFDMFSLYGTLRLAAAANNWDILDDKDAALMVPATPTDPAWLLAISARIAPNTGQTITGTNADILKIGQSLADVAFVANSTAVAAAALAAQEIRSANLPYAAPTQVVANTTFKAFLHVANAAPVGTLAITVAANSGAKNFLRVPVEIIYFKRSQAIRLEDIPMLSIAQQKLDLGVV